MNRLLLLIVLGTTAWGQSQKTPATIERPSYESPLPVLLEVGTYHSAVTNGYGYRRDAEANANWSMNSPTTEGFSFAPKRNGCSLFPHERYDVKVFYEARFNRQLVLAAGYSIFCLAE